MNLRYRKLMAIVLTAFIFLTVFRLIDFSVSCESSRNYFIQERNLEEIIKIIDDSGVDKEELSIALREDTNIFGDYFFMLFQCLVIVWIYNFILRQINRVRIFNKPEIPKE